jgi:hypothetical protein
MPPTPVSPPVFTLAIVSSSLPTPISTQAVASTPASTSPSAGVIATPFPASTSTPARNVSLSPTPSTFRSAPPALPTSQRTQAPDLSHHMVTRAKAGQFFPNKKYTMVAATVTALSPVPTTVCKALADPNWWAAMWSECDALLTNRTWTLVPHPLCANVVTGKWVFKHKFWPDGSFDKYKARWVVHGFTQRARVDFGETFAPVIKPGTVCQ